ncbi:MAG: hypothetical protein ABR577_09220 [Pyrinomonadaceae bacterium]
MKTTFAISFVLISALFSLACTNKEQQQPAAPDHIQWVFRSLIQIETVHVGMTREELLKVFTEEGGLSTRFHQTYVYRECPYMKVDVEFAATVNKQDKLTKDLGDKITKISRPYLGGTIMD